MIVKELIIICSLFFCFSCTTKDNKDDKSKKADLLEYSENKTNEIEADRQENKIEKESPLIMTLAEVNIKSIKEKFINSNTSGKLSQKQSENYAPKEKAKFYGVYFFTQNESEIPFIGKAVVACQNQDEWSYSNGLEELVEFNTFSNDLNPFSNILKIGQSRKDVIQSFGKDFTENSNNLIYSDKLGNAAVILIKNDTVQAIKVGKYNSIKSVTPIILKW